MDYRPLPDCLTVRDSKIHGLGVFATEDIPKDTILGMTHVKVRKMIVRTPLGGLYNHSNNPNCVKFQPTNDNSVFFLTSLKDIKKGEEITVQYTLYSMRD